MAEFKCPARKHKPARIVWLQVMPGPTRKSLRPWCRECLLGSDSVLVSTAVCSFYTSPSVSFPIVLSSVEENQRKARAAEQYVADPEPHDAAREQELSVLTGCYRGRTTQRLLAAY